MQTDENKKDIPMVDIDTSGPEQEIELNDDVQAEEKVEAKEDDVSVEETNEDPSPSTQEASSEEQDSREDKKEELENYSKDVQRRIAKLTKKWREAQRQADEALTFARIQKDRAEKLSKRYSSVEQAGVKDREARIKASLLSAQAKLTAAREEGNIAAEVEANKEIAVLGYEEAKLAETKQIAEEVTKTESRIDEIPAFNQQPQQQTTQLDPKAEEWGAKNKWFGTDTAMTYTAFDIHNKLESEGYDPQSDEYYAEIDKRIRLEFPHKFATNTDKVQNTTKPVQQVAAATRSTKTGRKTVRLTPSQVAIAKKLGVSLEDYAKQLKIMKEV